MRELERTVPLAPELQPLAIVGAGRVGGALAGLLRDAGVRVIGPLGRGADGAGAAVVLLCVPDGHISAAAAAIGPGPLVGHCSGSRGLEVLVPHERFSLHPLMTFTGGSAGRLHGAGAAIDGSSARALACAAALAQTLGLHAIRIAPQDRAAYHAAASVASNFLLTLQAAAERIAAGTGLRRELLVALVRATVDNWAALGAREALTGPVARGDHETVAAQRAAVAQRAPELLELFDALCAATARLARETRAEGGLEETRALCTVEEVRSAHAEGISGR
jgi:predicted short-subunit dehydrogenase-like oxidoreductase (DUF2520 family)